MLLVCRNVLFYYGTGVTFGLLASLLVVIFVVSRFIPKVVIQHYVDCIMVTTD